MKKISACLCLMVLLLSGTSFQLPSEWTPLLDKNLSKWETYQSFYHKVGYKGKPPVDSNGLETKPIGYNVNKNNVFSVVMEDGQPILKITGEIYGCIFTKQDFANYHLKLKFRWGTKKWVPRLDELKDSGLLYHSQGKCGVEWFRTWMLSQEFQVVENSTGDYWSQSSSMADAKALKDSSYKFNSNGHWTPLGGSTGNGGFCEAGAKMDKPIGQWNEIELITYGDKSLHIVNGKVVMALKNSRFKDGDVIKPLTHGKLQLQSEAAEVYYKDIMIKPIKEIPAGYAGYFE
ncbi:3-keto-disaccharide hydrolase [Mucilaginibacter psychrotolerans]|uniref:DUF1080 domain-containing protein n=1 Tax=Mucilaginibacter psychrotolerans TaxID=1524096 RepID=A0A4Y8SMA9_9SPHI|nr:DUF1080 domain-containing protein [Mucilaginibacter psychrotolerans]TFF40088.1 DUF1080 domain-containing protein [Mucilaginibacter psychrotolerans]